MLAEQATIWFNPAKAALATHLAALAPALAALAMLLALLSAGPDQLRSCYVMRLHGPTVDLKLGFSGACVDLIGATICHTAIATAYFDDVTATLDLPQATASAVPSDFGAASVLLVASSVALFLSLALQIWGSIGQCFG